MEGHAGLGGPPEVIDGVKNGDYSIDLQKLCTGAKELLQFLIKWLGMDGNGVMIDKLPIRPIIHVQELEKPII